MASATVAGKEWNAEMRFRRADGNVVRVSCSAAPVRDEAGTVRGYIGTLTDVTALKESEERFQQQAEELRRSNRELEQFAYIASHEFSRNRCGWSPTTRNCWSGVIARSLARKRMNSSTTPWKRRTHAA